MDNPVSQPIGIAEGFREDCEEILGQFEKTENRNFQEFSEIWRNMKFAQVYWNRTSNAEMMGFCEEALAIAKEFISPSKSDSQRVGGIFLLYGLYFKCPIKSTKIRMTMSDWEAVLKHREYLFTREEFEAVYVLNRLIEARAFNFCLTEREMGLESYYTSNESGKSGNKSQEKTEVTPTSEKSEEILSVLSEISTISDSYMDIKQKLIENEISTIPRFYTGAEIQKMVLGIKSVGVGRGEKIGAGGKGRGEFGDDFIDEGSLTDSDDDDDDDDEDYDADVG